MMSSRVYVVSDEPSFMYTQYSDDQVSQGVMRSDLLEAMETLDDYSGHSVLWGDGDSEASLLTDIEILRCVAPSYVSDPDVMFSHLITKTPPMFTREDEDFNRQLEVLMKGFPEPKNKPTPEPFPELKKVKSKASSKKSASKKVAKKK